MIAGLLSAGPAAAAGGAPIDLWIAPRELHSPPGRAIYETACLQRSGDTTAVLPADSLLFSVHLPVGFHLVPGSLALEGDTLGLISTGNPVVVSLPAPPGPEGARIHYALRPDDSAELGRYTIVAHVYRGDTWLSGNAVSVIDLEGGRDEGQRSFYGTIFHDINRNGRRDTDEEGIGGVAVALEDGTRTTSDARGHFAFRAMSGTHLVRLDAASLPEGASVKGGADRLYDCSALGGDALEFAVVSAAETVAGLGDAGHGSGAAASAAAGATKKSGCEELTPSHRDAWGGYFVLDFASDRARFARLQACPPLPPPEAATATASRGDLTPLEPTIAVEGGTGAAKRPGAARAGSPASRPAEVVPSTVSLEVGQKMFGLSSSKLAPGYDEILEKLGSVFRERGVRISLHGSPEERRDGPSAAWLDAKRIAAVDSALGRGLAMARHSTRPGIRGGDTPLKSPPRAFLESLTYRENTAEARLVLTLSNEVPFASGGLTGDSSATSRALGAAPAGAPASSGASAAAGSESLLLLVLHTALAEGFHMPDIPEGSLVRRVSLDLTDANGSLLLIAEPAAGATARVQALRDPYRIEILFDKQPE